MRFTPSVSYFMQSSLIWLLTNVIGSSVLWIILERALGYIELLALSSLFSIPAIALVIPTLYILEFIQEPGKRIMFAVFSMLAICAIVLMIFMVIIPNKGDTAIQIGKLLLPYVVAAPICFIFVVEVSMIRRFKSNARKTIR